MELSRAVKGNVGLWQVRIEYGEELTPSNKTATEFDKAARVNLCISVKNNKFTTCHQALEVPVVNSPLTVEEALSFYRIFSAAISEMKTMGLLTPEQEKQIKGIEEEDARKVTL